MLNNPLSYTDRSGFFFKKIFKAIGKFFKAVFKAVKAVFKATNGEIAGFALTGECTKERDSLAGLTLPIMA